VNDNDDQNSSNNSSNHVEEVSGITNTATAASDVHIVMPWNQAYLVYFPSSQSRLPRTSSHTVSVPNQAPSVATRPMSRSAVTQSAQYELVSLNQSDNNNNNIDEEKENAHNSVDNSNRHYANIYSSSNSSLELLSIHHLHQQDHQHQVRQTEAEIYCESSVNLSIFLLCQTVLFSILDYTNNQILGRGSLIGFVWLQAILPFAQLSLIVSLCREKKDTHSSVYKILTSRLAVWLGDRSMCIYLLHWPIIYYVCWAVYGNVVLTWPATFDCASIIIITEEGGKEGKDQPQAQQISCYTQLYEWNRARIMPLWGVPVVVVLTLLVSDCVYRLIEVPVRRYLKCATDT